jgi:hypothetical protein
LPVRPSRSPTPITNIAPQSTATEIHITTRGLRPDPAHSPATAPQKLAEMIAMEDISGQPTTAASSPRREPPIP